MIMRIWRLEVCHSIEHKRNASQHTEGVIGASGLPAKQILADNARGVDFHQKTQGLDYSLFRANRLFGGAICKAHTTTISPCYPLDAILHTTWRENTFKNIQGRSDML